MKYYIKVKTGFNKDQNVIIPMQEAHKAYYLFKHPEERGIFENGVALIGKNIQEILPAWNETMGYNPDYVLTEEDWNIINGSGAKEKMRLLLEKAKQGGDLIEGDKSLGKLELKEVIKLIPETKQLFNEDTKKLANILSYNKTPD